MSGTPMYESLDQNDNHPRRSVHFYTNFVNIGIVVLVLKYADVMCSFWALSINKTWRSVIRKLITYYCSSHFCSICMPWLHLTGFWTMLRGNCKEGDAARGGQLMECPRGKVPLPALTSRSDTWKLRNLPNNVPFILRLCCMAYSEGPN